MSCTRREAIGAALSGAAAYLQAQEPIPTVAFGADRVSRLIVGGNPVSGNSHQNPALSREMMDYFTSSNIKRLLRNCEEAGINTWQSRGDRHILRLLREYRQEGGAIQWIGQTASEISFPRNLSEMTAMQPLGIYHHGSQTDKLWQAGKPGEIEDNLKAIRQTGVRVGLGTHLPEVIDHAESKSWDVDFYMTCIYNLSRGKEEAGRLAGRPIDDELFWDTDRVPMLERVRATRKQCLVFKVYGAGRHCDSRDRMLAALKLVFRYAKPSDCIVVGMFPKYREQVRENCALLREAARAEAT